MTLAQYGRSAPSSRITQAKQAEDRHSAASSAQAARTVADHAANAQDCGELLAMLGLDVALRASRQT